MKSSWESSLRQNLRRSRRTAFVGIGQELRGDDAAGLLVIRKLTLLSPFKKNAYSSLVKELPSFPFRAFWRRITKAGQKETGKEKGARMDALLFIEAGPLPESATGPLRRFAPDLAVFIDAADMGADPGSIAWLAPDELTGVSALSHALPLSVLFTFLKNELGCATAILGIQPAQTEFDSPPSAEVQAAVERAAASILRLAQSSGWAGGSIAPL